MLDLKKRKPQAVLLISLLFPTIALVLFHYVNISHRRLEDSFLYLPYHFLSNLASFSLAFPQGFWSWLGGTAVGFGAVALLGGGILACCRLPKEIAVAGAFPVGIGLVGTVLEWIALAGKFTTPLVWAVFSISSAAGIGLIWWVRRIPTTDSESRSAPFDCVPSSLHRSAIWCSFGILTWFSFQHAVFYPPNYWDALIYYLYYAKLIFLHEGIPFPVDPNGFPELVQGHVGLGLGANYPHLYLLWQAATCKAFGVWSAFPGQWIAPIAGAGTALLVRRAVLERWRNETVSLWAMLLVHSVPYWLFYQNWESDYPIAVWLTISSAALLSFRLEATDRSGRVWRLIALVSIAIAGSHLNYLMVTLWWFPLLYLLYLREEWTNRRVWGLFAIGILMSSTWLIRNQIVTGNPVYAFFPEVFGGINIDLDVLESCEVEWTMNGDGLIGAGQTLRDRILGTPRYFLLDPNTHIKWATLPLGWVLPGILLGAGWFRRSLFQTGVVAYTLLLVFYEYAISPIYLYHILPAVPLLVLIACPWMVRLSRWTWSRIIHTILLIIVSLTVGLPAALLGAKISLPSLFHTLQPGMDPEVFLRYAIGEYTTWERMNGKLPPDSVILTHENRHYYLRDDLKFVHLDDYRLVPLYKQDGEKVLNQLRQLGVGYYLHVANERNHPILKLLGIEALLERHFTLLSEEGETRLYKLKGESEG